MLKISKFLSKRSKKTVIDTIKSKDGTIEIQIIEDTAMPSGDAGHLLQINQKKPIVGSLVNIWPDPKSEKRATIVAKKIITVIDSIKL